MSARTVRLVLAAFVVLLLAPHAAAQFDAVRRAVDSEIGGSEVWIPFKGLARFYVKTAHPEGVHDFQFAIYEDARAAGPGTVEAIFRKHLGSEWRPFVRVTSHRDGEQVLIYAREGNGGETIDLMIFAGDPEETVLMSTTLHVERFIEGLDDPGGFASR
jgi:hypothetical protein